MAQVPVAHPPRAPGLLLHPPLPPHAEVRDEGDLRDPGQVSDHEAPASRLVPEPGLQGMFEYMAVRACAFLPLMRSLSFVT